MICFYIFVSSVVLVVHGNQAPLCIEYPSDQLTKEYFFNDESQFEGISPYGFADIYSLLGRDDPIKTIGPGYPGYLPGYPGLPPGHLQCPGSQQVVEEIMSILITFLGSIPNNCNCNYPSVRPRLFL